MSFTGIYKRYHQGLYRYCLAIVGNPEDAQDALQNTMLKAMRALRDEKREIKLKPWLYRIAHNESIDLLRKRRPTEEIDVELAAGVPSAEETLETRERLRGLMADLGELPDRQRGALTMREMAGLSFKQIADAFDTSPAVARQTVYEARVGLQQMREGREMSCEDVRRAISDGDGRIVRRRDIRAHLRDCPDCRAFREAIGERRGDFAALAPLPALAAASLLRGILAGGGSASGAGVAGAVGAGAGKAVATSAIAKSAATVAVVAVVGAGAADRSGLIDVPLPGEGKSTTTESSSQPQADDVPSGSGASGGQATEGAGRSTGGEKGGSQTAPGKSASQGSKSKGQKNGHGGRRDLPAASNHGQQTAAAHRATRGGRSAAHAPARGQPSASPPPHSNAKPRSGGTPNSSPAPPPTDVAPDKPTPDTSQPSNPGNSGAPRASARQASH